jgi:hypothetical protein
MPDEVGDIVEGAVNAVTNPATIITAGITYFTLGLGPATQVLIASSVSGAVAAATA